MPVQSAFLTPEANDALQSSRLHSLRRGTIISDIELLQDEGNQQVVNDDDLEDTNFCFDANLIRGDEAVQGETPLEVKWGTLPEGLTIAPRPTTLDESLVTKLIYMPWEPPHGWCLGTIVRKYDQSSPRLYAKFNYRVEWMDGWGNHNLILDNYGAGKDAPYNSWVLLTKSNGREGERVDE